VKERWKRDPAMAQRAHRSPPPLIPSASSAFSAVYSDLEGAAANKKRPRPSKGRERVHSRGTTLIDGRQPPTLRVHEKTPVRITETNPGQSTRRTPFDRQLREDFRQASLTRLPPSRARCQLPPAYSFPSMLVSQSLSHGVAGCQERMRPDQCLFIPAPTGLG